MLRDEDQIVRAHDLIIGVLMEEIEVDLPEGVRDRMAEVAGVLCWVLRHDHNRSFPDNLVLLETLVDLAGYQLRTMN